MTAPPYWSAHVDGSINYGPGGFDEATVRREAERFVNEGRARYVDLYRRPEGLGSPGAWVDRCRRVGSGKASWQRGGR